MSEQLENLTQVATELVAQRKSLFEQLDGLKVQQEVGAAQLKKFDTLIAVLQVAVDTPAVLDAALTQEAANATVSPSGPAEAANEAAAGITPEAAPAAV